MATKRQGSPIARAKQISSDFVERQKDLNIAGVNFLKTDLETALTFSSMALETDDPVKKRRMTRKARQAFDTITHLLGRVTMSASDTQFMDKNLRRLKRELGTLGETFQD